MKMETGTGPPHEQVMEELLRGRKFTNEFKHLLQLGSSNSDLSYLQQDHRRRENDLVAKILYSFKKSISILTHQTHRISPHEDSADSLNSSAHKERRGSYKRRKCGSDSWTREHSTPNIEDGHSWRKYGQKTIHGYKHHRSYYRCTHKFEQRCPAKKQVQQIEDEPAAKYITTFFGHHTCSRINLVLKYDHDDHHLMEYYNFDQSTADSTSKIMLSFANPSTTHDHPAAPPATITSGTSNSSATDNFNMMMMMMSPQQQQQTSFLSSVGQGGDFAANSSTAAAASSHDYDHLLPSDDHDLTATFESALTNFHHHQVDEFDDADVLGFVF